MKCASDGNCFIYKSERAELKGATGILRRPLVNGESGLVFGQSKPIHQLFEAAGLGGELLAGRRAFLGSGAVGLNYGGR